MNLITCNANYLATRYETGVACQSTIHPQSSFCFLPLPAPFTNIDISLNGPDVDADMLAARVHVAATGTLGNHFPGS